MRHHDREPQSLVFPLGTRLVVAVAVADGLGGQPTGEVAGSLGVRQLLRSALAGRRTVRP
ncbi:hypothetical protein [Streptomyces sp. ISL-100]|uniref:hypothetical protein n=1 Tax=Streptomyces sp. ISL-100 TaxID=2819173 RepID=UPI001BEAEA2C|nr:hypothetical protein [Streptomyces sp. ISL-100]MBT2400866.1 hypothetical protein [Streptomyces sp. ISL-100]